VKCFDDSRDGGKSYDRWAFMASACMVGSGRQGRDLAEQLRSNA